MRKREASLQTDQAAWSLHWCSSRVLLLRRLIASEFLVQPTKQDRVLRENKSSFWQKKTPPRSASASKSGLGPPLPLAMASAHAHAIPLTPTHPLASLSPAQSYPNGRGFSWCGSTSPPPFVPPWMHDDAMNHSLDTDYYVTPLTESSPLSTLLHIT